MNIRLSFYPAFKSQEDLSDHFYRALWYLYPYRSKISKITFPVESASLKPGDVPEYLDPALAELAGALNVEFQHVQKDKELIDSAMASDGLLLWSTKDMPGKELSGKKIIKIDHHNSQFAGSFYLRIHEHFPDIQDINLDHLRSIFARVQARCKSDVGYVFGTGPGLSKALERGYDFSDGVCIACNSMVRNYELMDKLNPPLITVADPIFHAGPSSYAAEFRKELVMSLDRYDADLVVPMRDYHIYRTHLPERFADRIVALPFVPGDLLNLDLNSEFQVTSTGNILTLFLLPLAATFFEETRIFGCDGRPLEQNSYFWSHDKASQFNTKMDDIQQAHPAFFKIDYDDYYLTHCETLETWVASAEASGRIIVNHTPSYIPALLSRGIRGLRTPDKSEPKASLVVPAYNAAQFLGETIESIQGQSFEDWELVIVDDYSTDNTRDIVNDYMRQDARIRVLSTNGKGVSAARNTGIKAALGQYIGFLDSDDTLLPGSLEARVTSLEEPGVDLVHSRVVFIGEDGRDLGAGAGARRDLTFRDMHGFNSHFNTIMGSRDVISSLEFPVGVANGEDWWAFAKLLRTGVKSHYVERGEATYRMHASSVVKKDMARHIGSLESVLDWIYSDQDDPGFPTMYRTGLTAPAKGSILGSQFVRGAICCGLDGDQAGLSYFSEKGELHRWLSEQSEDKLKQRVTTILSQRFAVPRDELSAISEADVRQITERESFKDLKALFPDLFTLVCEILHLDPENHCRLPSVARSSEASMTNPAELNEVSSLGALRNRFKGERCFIIGNGPSLNSHDLALIQDEFTFGANALFYKTDEMGFVPTFYSVEDTKVLEENIDRIRGYGPKIKFFPEEYRKLLDKYGQPIFFNMDKSFYKLGDSSSDSPKFSRDANEVIYCGQTVTYINLQLAFYMGFSEVYLIGMDFHYVVPKEHVKTGNHILSTTDDPNHFHKDYFGKGKTWKDPKLDRVALSYRQAKLAYEADGRRIYNATVGGKLEIFPRVDYETLLRDPVNGGKRREKLSPEPISGGGEEAQRALQYLGSPASTVDAGPSVVETDIKQGPRTKAEIRAARRAKFRRDPHLYFKDSHFFLLRPLQYLFRPTGVSKWQAEMDARTRHNNGGLFSFLPVSRRKLAESLASQKNERIQLEATLRGEIARLQREANERKVNFSKDVKKVREEFSAAEARVQSAQQALKADNAERLASTVRQIDALSGKMDKDIFDRVEGLRARFSEDLAALDERLALVSKATADGEAKLRSELARLRELGNTREARRRDDGKKVEREVSAINQRLITSATNLAECEAKLRVELAQLAKLLDVREAREVHDRQALKDEITAFEARLADEIAKLAENRAALEAELGKQHAASSEAMQDWASVKARLDELSEASENAKAAAKAGIDALKSADAQQAKSTQLLRKRIMTSERQIGALRYADGPQTLVLFGHHKCASRLFRSEIFQIVAEATGAQVHQYKVKSPPFHYSRGDELDLCNINFEDIGKNERDVVLFSNATERSLERLDQTTTDWRGIRIIRDPRQVLVSNYFHHKGNHHVELNGWVYDQLKRDQPILRELPEEEGLLHELDNISKDIIETQILAPFEDERILTLKLEDFARDQEAWLKRISEFLHVADIAGADLSRTFANPDSSPWQQHFTTGLRKVFKERYGQALIDLGYATDLSW